MKYLAVDLGNVVCGVDFTAFISKLSKCINVSFSDVDYFLNRTQKLHDLGLTDLRSELQDHFKIHSESMVDELMVEWNNTISANPHMISILAELIHQDAVKVALLSNIGFEHAAVMESILTKDVYDHSIKFFSCQVGARKPTYLYYKTFLDMYPDFKGCLYLDDRPENIKAGDEFGFNTRNFVLSDLKSDTQVSAGINFLRKRFK